MKPPVLIFDVNETLLDIDSLTPTFGRIFGDERIMREWFNGVVMYSMTLTLSGIYKDFFSIGQGILKMLGEIYGIEVSNKDLSEVQNLMANLPPHPDAAEGLEILKNADFKMVTLTNSPRNEIGSTPLERGGLTGYFERHFNVEMAKVFKPSQILYKTVAKEMGVGTSDCCMIAAHVWDIIGAQSAGMSAALLTRPTNAPLVLDGLPQPDIVARTLPELAHKIVGLWRS